MFAMNPINDAFHHPDNKIDVIRADGSGLTLLIAGPGCKGSPTGGKAVTESA